MVGVARGTGNESTQRAQGVSPRLASECRGLARPHGQALYQDNQSVCGALRKMSSKCPALMAEIKDLVPWLHENKIPLDVVYIRSEANLADVSSSKQDLDMWSLQLPKQQELLHLVKSTLGSQVCTDPFACRQSAVAPSFATPIHCRCVQYSFRPPKWQCVMGKFDDLMIKVAPVQRRLSRGHRRCEVWS